MATKEKPNAKFHWLDIDVVTAAKARIRYLLDAVDELVVSFSGGKDSLAVLSLVKEVYDEDGINKPVKVLFYDEEVINPMVIEFVNSIRQLPWVDMLWLCIPLESNKASLGRLAKYVQWQPNRPTGYMREKPEWAITQIPGYDKDQIFSQYMMGKVVSALIPNKRLVSLTGVRADESLRRLQGILTIGNIPFFSQAGANEASLARPIYDWTENDVFKYFYDSKIEYCGMYNVQSWLGMNMRVASALTSEGTRTVHLTQNQDPKYAQRLIEVFPEMLAHFKYHDSARTTVDMNNLPNTEEGLKAWIDEQYEQGRFTEEYYEMIVKNVEDALRRRHNSIEAGKMLPFGGFPLTRIYAAINSGSIRRGVAVCYDYKDNDYQFEGLEVPTEKRARPSQRKQS